MKKLLAAVIVLAVSTAQAGVVRVNVGNCPRPSNYVNLYALRVDGFCCPVEEFLFGIDVVVPGVAGVSDVAVETGDGTVLALLGDDDCGVWSGGLGFPDVVAMRAVLDGAWTVIITATSSSTSTFVLNAAQLGDSDFFATPTRVDPANDETGVPADVVFAWNDPTGTPPGDGGPDVLFVFVDSDIGIGKVQEDDSINGTLSITDTTWDPPMNVPPGQDEFGVFYADLPCLVGRLNVTPRGSVTWDDSPLFGPSACPTSPAPLLVLGSGTIVGFDVDVCPWNCGGDNDGNVGIVDFLALLSQWGSPGSCDFDGGGVGIVDFLALLANWGPCP